MMKISNVRKKLEMVTSSKTDRPSKSMKLITENASHISSKNEMIDYFKCCNVNNERGTLSVNEVIATFFENCAYLNSADLLASTNFITENIISRVMNVSTINVNNPNLNFHKLKRFVNSESCFCYSMYDLSKTINECITNNSFVTFDCGLIIESLKSVHNKDQAISSIYENYIVNLANSGTVAYNVMCGYLNNLSEATSEPIIGMNDDIRNLFHNKVKTFQESFMRNPDTCAKDNATYLAYCKLNESLLTNRSCVRVHNNHEILSKRYNLDKYVQENYNILSEDQTDMVLEICDFIDTYSEIPFETKFNIALENTLYIFDKNHIKYDFESVVETVVDWTMYNHNMTQENKDSMYRILKSNVFVNESDIANKISSDIFNNTINNLLEAEDAFSYVITDIGIDDIVDTKINKLFEDYASDKTNPKKKSSLDSLRDIKNNIKKYNSDSKKITTSKVAYPPIFF